MNKLFYDHFHDKLLWSQVYNKIHKKLQCPISSNKQIRNLFNIQLGNRSRHEIIIDNPIFVIKQQIGKMITDQEKRD
jgi:hypothetical protein